MVLLQETSQNKQDEKKITRELEMSYEYKEMIIQATGNVT